jgi:3-hydroxyacyl-CoA dehydrogenase / 3-hydroxy-2-methylbutyryl-CoA dehydrogenase
MELKDKVAVISGGASGLGEATSRLFVERGAKVCLMDLNEDRGEALVSELGKGVAIFAKTDVSDEESVQAAADAAEKAFGAIQVAVCCAGVPYSAKVLGGKGPFPMDLFNKTVHINLMGTMHIIRSAGMAMLKNEPNEDGERGVVINCSSGAAFEGQIGQAAYSASKAALVGMTLPIAREFADYGIRVMTIAPGLFDTPMLGGLSDNVKESLVEKLLFPKRMANPMEFAILAAHIVENAQLNGRTIRLDGGYVMQPR